MKQILFKHETGQSFLTPIIPASKALPAWYKKASAEIKNDPWSTTFKSCMPMLDAMTQGYIIPLWSDVYVSVDKNNETGERFPTFTWDRNAPELISTHSPEQTHGLAGVEKGYNDWVFKFHSPWFIQTPIGYSSLFVSPLNNAYPHFQMFSAVVATDQYMNNVNLPFVYTGPEDWEGMIPQGTPLIQVIPFKRDDFKHEISEVTPADRNLITSTHEAMVRGYRYVYKRLWRRPTRSI